MILLVPALIVPITKMVVNKLMEDHSMGDIFKEEETTIYDEVPIERIKNDLTDNATGQF